MIIPIQNCSSCAACANVCPRNAISMQPDADGFYRPIIEANKCIKCGMCERACPWNKPVENPNAADVSPKTVAAYAKDESVRLQSSSGGIFSVLAERVLDDGGVVVGVAQLDKTHFGHIVVDNKADLAKLRGSKYVQADVGLVYREVRSLLKSGRKVLFSGTPCQVAGLYAVLGYAATSADLFTVDIVCHGTPSVKVFEKYVTEIEKDKSALVKSTRFRDKRNGWRLFSMTTSLNTISGDCFQFSKELHKDKFMRLFLQNICLNTSCADCHYSKLPRIADITLGDYWNIARVHPQMDDNKGTSVVCINTCQGEKMFKSVAQNVIFCKSKIEYAVAGMPSICRSTKPNSNRKKFFEQLEHFNLNELIKNFCPYPSILETLFYWMKCSLSKIKTKIILKYLSIKNHKPIDDIKRELDYQLGRYFMENKN